MARRSTSTAARCAECERSKSKSAMNILLTPARIGPAEIPNRIVMPPMTTRGSDDEGHVTDQTIAYYMARVRGGVGLITVEMASPEKAGRHRRRELGIYRRRLPARPHAPGRRNPSRRRQGLDPARPRRRPHPRRHLRRDADRALGHPASGLRDDVRDHRAGGDEQAAHRADHGGLHGGGGARAAGRLRLRRDPRRARLPDLAVPRAVREPPHRRIRRLAGKPRPLRARRAARGEGRGAVAGRDLPAVGRRLLRRRADLRRGQADCDLGGGGRRRRAARHRRTLSLAADGASHDPADDRAGRDLPRLRRRREEGDRRAGDRRRPARRSENGDGRGGKRQGRFHRARPHADRRSAMGREAPPRRADPAVPRLQHLHRRHARRRRHFLRGQRRGRPRDEVRQSHSRRAASASR